MVMSLPAAALDLVALGRRSVAVIRANQAPSGAYLASPAFPVYRFSWFRDGAFIADAMSRAGHEGSARRFFAWCDAVVLRREAHIEALVRRGEAGETIADSEFLHTRYTVDGDDGPDDWWTFQLDGYGTWLWALGAHVARTGEGAARHDRSVDLTVRYLLAFWDRPCYDWWEEHLEERHTSTLAAIAAGLRSAVGLGVLDAGPSAAAAATADRIVATIRAEAERVGTLVKWLGGDSVDASLIACSTPFDLLPVADPVMVATRERVERELGHPEGGVHRYLDDTYYGGGKWLLLAAFLGWHRLREGDAGAAEQQLRWIAAQADEAGDLPEQTLDHLLAPAFRSEWEERWGRVAKPLLWSHAMFLTLALESGSLSREQLAEGGR
jgi:isomaltose glucohydrolase